MTPPWLHSAADKSLHAASKSCWSLNVLVLFVSLTSGMKAADVSLWLRYSQVCPLWLEALSSTLAEAVWVDVHPAPVDEPWRESFRIPFILWTGLTHAVTQPWAIFMSLCAHVSKSGCSSESSKDQFLVSPGPECHPVRISIKSKVYIYTRSDYSAEQNHLYCVTKTEGGGWALWTCRARWMRPLPQEWRE